LRIAGLNFISCRDVRRERILQDYASSCALKILIALRVLALRRLIAARLKFYASHCVVNFTLPYTALYYCREF